MRLSLMLAGFLCATAAQAQEKPVLTVLTYDSFVSEWGPGPIIEEVFERDCNCDLQFVAAGDGAALMARLLLEGAKTDADVVLGLDTSLTAQAADTGLFAPHGLAAAPDVPVAYDDPLFTPYDWGWFAFVYDTTRLAVPPKDFVELGASDAKIVIQDPRSSTPGLGLMLWVKAAYGDDASAVWQALADNIVTVTPGWSEAYGLFLEGEADMVLSYSTSPAYHVIAESDVTKEAAPFAEGHYLQIEVAGRLAASDQPELADRFMAFIHSPAFQGTIPETNWMYPATTSPAGLPQAFEWLIWPEKSLLMSPQEAQAARGPALAEWRAALAR
ncbi:thiamine ABC transporter substrate binding subunit [Phaeovulum sp.]|uniref:thiamine ABC transporter substrate binding subunit n=1 Tax=Phaeovulum sp. TaxID=2934796 RepID=UPI003565C636